MPGQGEGVGPGIYAKSEKEVVWEYIPSTITKSIVSGLHPLLIYY